MSKDLLTYYGQTPRIDQLVEKYGAYLEQVDREVKLLLRITLSHYVLMKQHCNPGDYAVKEALNDGLFVRFITKNIPQVLIDICAQLEGLTIDEAESILDALQHQIHWGQCPSPLK
ncbi:MAG TPA: hypothetical protein V6D25_12195 [Leptolyngbyaceae cyanobacterium]